MGFLIREGARLVVRLPQEVDHHKTESIRIQVDQMIRKEPVTEVEFEFFKNDVYGQCRDRASDRQKSDDGGTGRESDHKSYEPPDSEGAGTVRH